jgi:hypothetical protein
VVIGLGRVGSTVGERRQRFIGRGGSVVAGIARAFLSLPATFAFVVFAFPFPIATLFTFGEEGIATTMGGFCRHIPVLLQEILLERGESTLTESGLSAPTGDIGVELGSRLNRIQKVIDSCKFGDVMLALG